MIWKGDRKLIQLLFEFGESKHLNINVKINGNFPIDFKKHTYLNVAHCRKFLLFFFVCFLCVLFVFLLGLKYYTCAVFFCVYFFFLCVCFCLFVCVCVALLACAYRCDVETMNRLINLKVDLSAVNFLNENCILVAIRYSPLKTYMIRILLDAGIIVYFICVLCDCVYTCVWVCVVFALFFYTHTQKTFWEKNKHKYIKVVTHVI